MAPAGREPRDAPRSAASSSPSATSSRGTHPRPPTGSASGSRSPTREGSRAMRRNAPGCRASVAPSSRFRRSSRFLHLVLFGFDPRAREHLFYACEMGAFAIIVLKEYREDLLATEAQREALDVLCQGIPVVAILAGLLTYYAVRTSPFPRTWRAFAGAAAALFVAFVRRGPPARATSGSPSSSPSSPRSSGSSGAGGPSRGGASGVFLASFAVFGFTIALQVLVVTGVLESVAGTRAVYVFGIVASAVGMSLYLARSFGEARLVAAENERRGQRALPRPGAAALDAPARPPRGAGARPRRRDAHGHRGGRRLLRRAARGRRASSSPSATRRARARLGDRRHRGEGALHVAASGRTAAGASRDVRARPLGDGPPAPEDVPRPRARLGARGRRRLGGDAARSSFAGPTRGASRSSAPGGCRSEGRLATKGEERRTALAPGDTLLFASDGFPELRTVAGDELGYDGAARAFREAASAATAREVVEALGAALARLRAGRPLEDDVTFVVVRVEAPPFR